MVNLSHSMPVPSRMGFHVTSCGNASPLSKPGKVSIVPLFRYSVASNLISPVVMHVGIRKCWFEVPSPVNPVKSTCNRRSNQDEFVADFFLSYLGI